MQHVDLLAGKLRKVKLTTCTATGGSARDFGTWVVAGTFAVWQAFLSANHPATGASARSFVTICMASPHFTADEENLLKLDLTLVSKHIVASPLLEGLPLHTALDRVSRVPFAGACLFLAP